MIRILFVVGFGTDVAVPDYQQEFRDFNVVMIRETDQFLRVVCEHNPQVIVSLGAIGESSHLWSLPLWRRSRWLNLPDGNVAAATVRMAALSLVAGTCGGKLFTDEPLFACIALDNNPQEVSRALIQLSNTIEYDNIEVLIPNHLFDEVKDLLGAHRVTGSICRISPSSDDDLISTIRSALAITRAQFLWPVSAHSLVNEENFLQLVLSVLTDDPNSAVITGCNISQNEILNFLEGNGENSICQFIFRPEHVLRSVQFEHDFPLTSLSGLLLSLVANTSTKYLHEEVSLGVTPNSWWSEENRNHKVIAQASINLTRQLQTT